MGKTNTIVQLLSRLKQLRAARGWTQEQFAEPAKMSYKYYQMVEAGRRPNLRLTTLETLARGFEVEVWELFAPDSLLPSSPSNQPRGRENAELEILEKFRLRTQPAKYILPLPISGVLAQLVERLNGIEEVRGSNPLGSTFAGPSPAIFPTPPSAGGSAAIRGATTAHT